MTHAACNSATIGDYADAIRALHLTDKRKRAAQSLRAVVLATLLTLLGGAALTGCAAKDSSPGNAHSSLAL